MKKLFTTLAVAFGISFGASAQATINPLYFNTTYFTPCQAATSNNITPPPSTTPGLSPSDSALPCGVRGTYVSDTIYFTNFTSFSSLPVNFLKIDSIYLPTGLCWNTNKPTNQFAGGESGVILVQGTTLAPAGQYKLRIIINAGAGPNGVNVINLTNQDAEALANLRYNVRIVCPTNACPNLNKTDTTDAYIAYTGEANCNVGINEVTSDITELSVAPNPFSATAKMTFTSETEGAYTVKMTNLLGGVVSTKEVNIVTGANEIELNRNGLSSGIYMVSISNGKTAVTRKVVIE